MKVFESTTLRNHPLRNRLIRSATFEGLGDGNGNPSRQYKDLYVNLAANNIGLLITGFTYIDAQGKVMHPGQAGIDHDNKIPFYKVITKEVHQQGSKIVLQIGHPGRQTSGWANGGQVYGVSQKKSPYFKETPKVLTTNQVIHFIDTFTKAAFRAQEAGFDGIQLHAAHGYLIHQFLLPAINRRKDEFGIDASTGIGTKFLYHILKAIRSKCRANFMVLIKISAGDDYSQTFTESMFINLVRFLNEQDIDGIEVSYGTMDQAFNIFRGTSIPYDHIFRHNPRYSQTNPVLQSLWKRCAAPILARKLELFTPSYNLPYAQIAKSHTDKPIFSVGGFRRYQEMTRALQNNHTDFISLCRPFICEPDFVTKLLKNKSHISPCCNCNACAVMVDSPYPTRCYRKRIGEPKLNNDQRLVFPARLWRDLSRDPVFHQVGNLLESCLRRNYSREIYSNRYSV